tara:strand:- start:493 stop:684 length:192 start_codon:yes stop_codon:yes gene_type:complete
LLKRKNTQKNTNMPNFKKNRSKFKMKGFKPFDNKLLKKKPSIVSVENEKADNYRNQGNYDEID